MSKKTVVGTEDVELFGVRKGRTCKVLKEDFYNGEGHYVFKDEETGEVFESPDVFWKDQD